MVRDVLTFCPMKWLGILVMLGMPTAAWADENEARKTEHKVDQALLYLKMGLPERAVESLSALVQEDPGDRDPIAWLALGRVHYTLQNLDEASRAVLEAERHGIESRGADVPWAIEFYSEFTASVGGIHIRASCDTVRFRIGLNVPFSDEKKRALLEAMPGWSDGVLERSTLVSFYMPSGIYRMGDVNVEFKWGPETWIGADEISAKCDGEPLVAAEAATPEPELVSAPEAGATTEASFFERTWLWWVVGAAAVVVAGGAGVAVATTGRDQVFDLR